MKKFLRLQTNGDLFFMDEQDWQKAKHVLWWWDGKQPVTKQGMAFAVYVGIRGVRRKDSIPYDFRRATYA